MKCILHFVLGFGRLILFILAIVSVPLWGPIAIVHDLGCDDSADRWIDYDKECGW